LKSLDMNIEPLKRSMHNEALKGKGIKLLFDKFPARPFNPFPSGPVADVTENSGIRDIIGLLRKIRWTSSWESGGLSKNIPYRFQLLITSRFWLAFCLVLIDEFEEACLIYAEANRLLSANLLQFITEPSEEKKVVDPTSPASSAPKLSGSVATMTMLQNILTTYNNMSASVKLSASMSVMAEQLLADLGTVVSSNEKPLSGRAEELRKQEIRQLSFAFLLGDFTITGLSTLEKIKWSRGDVRFVLDTYRGILGINQPEDQVKESQARFAKAFQASWNHPTTIAVRCTLYEKFASVLMFSISRAQYYPLEIVSGRGKPMSTPKSEQEEAVLLLLLALREAQKLYPPKSSKIKSLVRRACIALAQISQYSGASDVLRHAVATDVDNFQMWYKLTLSLMASKDYAEAFLAVRHCLHINPENLSALLVASKLCLNYLSDSGSAVDFSKRALEIAVRNVQKNKDETGLVLMAKYTYGVCCSKYAYEVSSFAQRKTLQEDAYTNLQEVYAYSKNNSKVIFHLAAIQADIREVENAIVTTKETLQLDPSNAHAWQLLALLSSSNKTFKKALLACNAGIQECGETSE
jgi:Flp pilus assembly protein TadD